MQNKKNENSESENLNHKNIIDGADIGTWVWNIQTNEITYNEKWASILGYTLNELEPLNTDTWKKLAHPDDIEKVVTNLKNYLEGKSNKYECQFRMQHKNGHWLWILDKGKIIDDQQNSGLKQMTGMHMDITEKMHLQESVLKQSEFQNLLLKIATTYINVNLEEVDTIIQQSLREMAEFVHADRAYIFSYDFQNSTTSNTFEWCADEISPEIDNLQLLSMDSIPFWVSKHLRGQPLHIPNIKDLPDDGPLGLRAILEPQGIQSLITIPMIHGDDLLGFVGFDFVKHSYELSEKEITLLTLFSNMLVNIQERKDKELKLNSFLSITQNQNEKLKHFAHILSHNIRSHSSNISMILALISDEYPELHEFQLIRLLNTASEKLSDTIRHLNKVILINTSSPEKLTNLNLYEIIEHTTRT
ncbi:MAG: PAS domain-containing protein, partial [Balneolaceae bacterium]|nr:PAS domain-containing protein [Balneolaceae bacterium]